jgi:hypothetical protein
MFSNKRQLIRKEQTHIQFVKPDWTRDTPIRVSMVPVIIEGNIFLIMRGGRNDMPIGNKAQSEAVPRKAPKALGQGSLVSPSIWQ